MSDRLPEKSTAYDPYHKLLGISPPDQPPTAYRLLGVDLFERDRDVIDAAANKQMAYLQSCCNGDYAADAERLLNEVSEARLRLLHPRYKVQYDDELRATFSQSSAAEPDPAAIHPVVQEGIVAPTIIPSATPPAIPTPTIPTPVIRIAGRGRRRGTGSLRWVLPVFVPSILSLLVAWKIGLIDFPRVEKLVTQKSIPVPSESSADQRAIDSEPMSNDTTNSLINPEPRSSRPDPAQSSVPIAPQGLIPPSPDEPGLGSRRNFSSEDQERLDSFRAMAQGTDQLGVPGGDLPTSDRYSGSRSPAPSAEELDAARQEVRETLASQIDAARSAHEKQHLATVCYNIAMETDRAAPKYALLQLAREYFALVNDFTGEMLAVDAMEARFDADLFNDHVSSLMKLVPAMYRPLDQVALADRADGLIATAMQREDYDSAIDLCGLCKKLATEFKNVPMTKKFVLKLDEATLLQNVSPTVEMARQRLQTQPDNAKANEYLGRFLCFGKSQWNEGLALLRLAENRNLAEIAELELQTRTSAVAIQELADRWWELALVSDQDPLLARESQARAVYWYHHAIAGGLSGLSKAAAQSRIDAFVAEQGDVIAIKSTPNADLRVPKPPRGVPPEAIHFNGNWYLFSTKKHQFRDAVAKAKSLNGRLVVVRSQAEHDFILQHARRPLLLGMLLKDGVWYDSLGEQQYFFLWDQETNEPNGGSKEPFAVIRDRSTGWADYPDGPLYFAIEWGKE